MANYPYRDLGIMLDLDNWQKLNDNFGDVATDLQLQKADYDAKLSTQQGEYNGKFGEVNARIDGIKQEISGEVLAEVIADASLIRQTPVDTFADLATVYPTPETGWAAMTRDTGKVYRYNGTEWLEVEDIDPTAINEVDNRLTSQLADKASKTYVDQVTQSIATGSPKGTYATVSELTTAFPTGNKNIYIVSADGNWYFWNGSAWTAGGVYQATGIADSSVSPTKTTFFEVGKNLANQSDPDFVTGGYYNSSGVFQADASRGETGYIEVTPGSTYTINGTKLNVYWYGVTKNYLSFTSSTDFAAAGYVTAPANAKYARFVFSMSIISTLQVEPGTTPTTFEPYFVKIQKSFIPAIDKDDIQNLEISPLETTFIRESRNLFNPDDPDVVLGGYYTSSGTFTASADRGETGYIPVTPSQTYTMNGLRANVYWYNASKAYLSTTTFTEFQTNGYVTAPTNAAFVRFIFLLADLNVLQVEKGTVSTAYEPYGTRLDDGIYLSSTQQNEVEKAIEEKGVTKTYTGKKLMLLGDSITSIGLQDRGWPKYFTEIIQNSTYINVAVAGATWTDKAGTVYDGNPVTNGADNNVNNVLGNQIQKIINNAYAAPDVIMIAAGTNDSDPTSYTMTDAQIESEFFMGGAVVPLANANRFNFAGAMRYAVEKLRELYPNAQIFLCTPLQRFSTTDSSYPIIKQKGDLIKRIGQRLSVPVIDSQEAGVYGLYAQNGVASGDFNDGLHLSPTGARKVGEYNARKFINWYSF